jgi:hypothetical protein
MSRGMNTSGRMWPPYRQPTLNCPYKKCRRPIVWVNRDGKFQAPEGEGCRVCRTPAALARHLPYLVGLRSRSADEVFAQIDRAG